MSGSLSDILTTAKNIVTQVATLGQQYLAVQGTQNSKAITATTLVKSGSGRLATLIVTVAGSGDGSIYDAISVAAAGATNLIWTIDNVATWSGGTQGPLVMNIPFKDGLVVAPGTGMTVVVSYS